MVIIQRSFEFQEHIYSSLCHLHIIVMYFLSFKIYFVAYYVGCMWGMAVRVCAFMCVNEEVGVTWYACEVQKSTSDVSPHLPTSLTRYLCCQQAFH